MKRYRLTELADIRDGHVFKDILPGDFICRGTMGYKPPGFRTHTHDGPDGADCHVHADDREAFVILQGRAQMEINGELHAMVAGDIIVVEPGEDHHLISDADAPCINLWLHAGAERHPDQQPRLTQQ